MRTKVGLVLLLAGLILGLSIDWLVAFKVADMTERAPVPGHLVGPGSPMPWRMAGHPARHPRGAQGREAAPRWRLGGTDRSPDREPEPVLEETTGATARVFPGPPEWSGAHGRVAPSSRLSAGRAPRNAEGGDLEKGGSPGEAASPVRGSCE